MRTLMLFTLFFALAPNAAAQPSTSSIQRKFHAIKPSASLLPWQKIPWVTDLEKGMTLAKKENRPLLIWGSDDLPLDRC